MTIKDELTFHWKVVELKKFASELEIKGRSKMKTPELIEAIAERMEQE